MELNKQLQIAIGKILGKDYFKLEFGQEVNGNGLHLAKIIWKSANTLLVLRNGSNKVESLEVNDTNLEIIGTEPTLQEILLGIEKLGKSNMGLIQIELLAIYDLNKTPFNQNDIVKNYIIKQLQ